MRFSLRDKVCIFIPCVLILTALCVAERDYFHSNGTLTWDDARSHCQKCFTELVTVTPRNLEYITRNLSSDHWIGLRKNLGCSYPNMSWTQWANGDPLSFQNWYPGWPVLRSSLPKADCCSCSCTCPAAGGGSSTTGFTHSYAEFTSAGVTSAGVTSASGLTGHATDNTTGVNGSTDATWGLGGSTDPTHPSQGTSGSTDPTQGTSGSTDPTQGTSGLTDPTQGTSGSTDPTQGTSGSTNFTQGTSGSTNSTQGTSSSGRRNVTTQNTPAFTAAPDMAECVRTPMVLSRPPEAHETYMEDSCVAMLRFGAWVEKNCSDLLHFICYEDRFYGNITVANVTNGSAQLMWPPAPGHISHYSVEVSGKKLEVTNLSYELGTLDAGSHYSVQVFPVKCERKLNPLNATFYTIPNQVTNLTSAKQTETCVFLSWDEPVGNSDFYQIQYDNKSVNCAGEEEKICDLIPGTLYTFTVLAGVRKDHPKLSEGVNITKSTRPGKVSQLRVSNNNVSSLLLTWQPPKGKATAFRVHVTDDQHHTLHNDTLSRNETPTRQEALITKLPSGVKVILSVTALARDTCGEKVTIESYTVPAPISNLTLRSTQDSVDASWSRPASNYSSFAVKLWLNGKEEAAADDLTETNKSFTTLHTAAYYTVIVYSVSGHLRSPPESESTYTLPNKPTNVKVTWSNKTSLTLQWTPPANVLGVSYLVNVSAPFWGHNYSVMVVDVSSHTFLNLTSGTRYYFKVQTLAGELQSEPAETSGQTEADKVEIGLSMLCSSSEELLCDNKTQRESVFHELETFFNNTLKNHIYWELQQGSENE